VLSQFSKSRRAGDDDEDNEADAELLAELEELDCDAEDEDDDREGEADRDDYDEALLADVDREMDEDVHSNVPILTRDDINLGRFAIQKVFFHLPLQYVSDYVLLDY
jgi:hypothetical protein